MYDQDTNWPKQLLLGVGVLLAVALLIGGIVGLVAVKATDLAGMGEETSTSEPEGLVIPERSPSPSESADPASEPTETASTPSKPATSKKPAKKKRPPPPITLSASPTSVGPMGRIDLTGSYRGGDGATLQVQRFEGGWANFPVDVTVRGSTFSTWIQSGREGVNRFRVLDTATGRHSKPVTVQIG